MNSKEVFEKAPSVLDKAKSAVASAEAKSFIPLDERIALSLEITKAYHRIAESLVNAEDLGILKKPSKDAA